MEPKTPAAKKRARVIHACLAAGRDISRQVGADSGDSSSKGTRLALGASIRCRLSQHAFRDTLEDMPKSRDQRNHATAVPALVGASILWGLSWLPLKGLNGLGMGGVALILVAYGAASVPAIAWTFRERHGWRGQRHRLWPIALLGGYANLAFSLALVHGEVVRVMVLFYLLPVWGVLGGRLFLGESIDWPRQLAVALALIGALLVLGGPEALSGSLTWIDLVALSSGVAFAGNNLLFRAHQGIPVPSKVAAMLVGCSLLALVMVSTGTAAPPPPSPAAWAWAGLYGLTWLLLANAGSQWGVTHMEAGRASIIIILELLTAVLSAVTLGGETMSTAETFGGMLILTAAVIEARR